MEFAYFLFAQLTTAHRKPGSHRPQRAPRTLAAGSGGLAAPPTHHGLGSRQWAPPLMTEDEGCFLALDYFILTTNYSKVEGTGKKSWPISCHPEIPTSRCSQFSTPGPSFLSGQLWCGGALPLLPPPPPRGSCRGRLCFYFRLFEIFYSVF